MKGWHKCPKCGTLAPQSAKDNIGWYQCECGNLFCNDELKLQKESEGKK